MGVSGGKGRKKGPETISEEMMAEHFPNLLKNINLYIQELNKLQTGSTFTHILSKEENKKRILKVAGKKLFVYEFS